MNRRLLAFAAAIGGLTQAACEDVRHVRLEVSPTGFICQTGASPQDPYLVQQAFAGRQPPPVGSLVVDFIRLGGLPDCRLPGLYQWCQMHSCTPIGSARVCIPKDLSNVLAAGPQIEQAMAIMLMSLHGPPIATDAPEGPLLVRLVGTAQTCDELARSPTLGFDFPTLFGCAQSCPVRLEDREESLRLDIDFLGSPPGTGHPCAPLVQPCASDPLP